MSSEHREYYAAHVMDRVNQIQLAVIGIGIAILAINYLGLVAIEFDVLQSEYYWQRLTLLLLVIVFASYTALVYNAYPVQARSSEGARSRVGYPLRVYSLFLLDIFQVTLAACMFGVLFIPEAVQLLDSDNCIDDFTSEKCLGLPEYGIEIIFALGALWHLSVSAWYAIADGFKVRDVPVHAIFAAVYVAMALIHQVDWFGVWSAAAGFALVLIALFVVQGRRWLGE